MSTTPNNKPASPVDHLRFHRPHAHLNTTFGTPLFLGAQTAIVAV